jgi:hypothetical protein
MEGGTAKEGNGECVDSGMLTVWSSGTYEYRIMGSRRDMNETIKQAQIMDYLSNRTYAMTLI